MWIYNLKKEGRKATSDKKFHIEHIFLLRVIQKLCVNADDVCTIVDVRGGGSSTLALQLISPSNLSWKWKTNLLKIWS